MAGVNDLDMEKVRQFLRNKEEKRRNHLYERWEKAVSDFNTIVSHIIQKYNPRRIYQWGSLLDFSRFSEISDIDIALEGVSCPEEYYAIIGDVMEMTSFPLDIVEIDKLDSETAEEIKRKGKLIYERER